MKIAVGLSGGVDSAVAAKILVDLGHEVLGVFMKNWTEETPNCPTEKDACEAEKVAQKLKIPFHVFDFSQKYWDEVFTHFLEKIRENKTPNPDIWCNKWIKFGYFLRAAESLGAEKIATGHYAKVEKIGEKFALKIPADSQKDQTYFLHQLDQNQLAKAVFPLAEIKKPEVRKIAKSARLPNFDRKDSTGICFIGERNFSKFLQKYFKSTPGKVRDLETGKVLGTHSGLSFYTIGQRRELGIGGVKNFAEAPFFVVEKDTEKNELVVSQNEKFLEKTEISVKNFHWISGSAPDLSQKFLVKIRYRDGGEMAKLFLDDSRKSGKIVFDSPVRAPAAGQFGVVFDGETCLGGGEIF